MRPVTACALIGGMRNKLQPTAPLGEAAFIDETELCRRLGVSRRTILTWRSCAQMPLNDERRDRTATHAAERQTRLAEAEIDRQLADAEWALAAMTYATLYAAGYHKRRGQWRKKRHARN